jgi:hypothetical protein
MKCQWFALCQNKSTGTTPHPILGDVATCDRCHKFATGEERPQTISATITRRAYQVLGLDDDLRYQEVTRSLKRGSNVVILTGTKHDLIEIATELNDRATEDHTGFNESAANKTICRAAVRSLRSQGIEARS